MKGRNFEIILYPESTSYEYDEVLIKYINYCNENNYWYFYILHDSDVSIDGTPAKLHCHLAIIIPKKDIYTGKENSDKTLKSIAKIGGISEQFIEIKNNRKYLLLYLAHQSPNSISKYSYDWHDIFTNNEKKLREVFDNDEETRNIYALIDYIDSVGYITYIDFTKFVLDNHLWSFYRRGGAIINNLIKEHNAQNVKYKRKDELFVDE